MFTNSRTGQRQKILRGYKSESEQEARARLEAAGWQFEGVDYTWTDSEKTFVVDDTDTEETTEAEGASDD